MTGQRHAEREGRKCCACDFEKVVNDISAFDDINNRTSRIASNVPLLQADLAPMSFVTMDDRDYIDGLLGIYELNNISLLREARIAGTTPGRIVVTARPNAHRGTAEP